MADLTQSSQAGIPNLTQDQIANTVAMRKISDKRKRNEMIRAGTQDPSAFAAQNQQLLSQASQPQDFWPAGGKMFNGQVSDPRLSDLFNVRTGVDGQQYYWGDIDPSSVTLGVDGYQTQDLGLGKYNILGSDGSVLGVGYKSVRDTLADYSKSGTYKNPVESNLPAAPLEGTGLVGQDSNAIQRTYFRRPNDTAVPEYGGAMGDWEALGQLLSGTYNPDYTPAGGKNTDYNPNLPDSHKWGDLPTNKQNESISGLDTLYGSSPVMSGNKLLGYLFDPTPGSQYTGSGNDNFSGTETGTFNQHTGKSHDWYNSAWREFSDGDWSNVRRLESGDFFVSPENASSIPGWTNRDSYEHIDKEYNDGTGTALGILGTVLKFTPLAPIGYAMSIAGAMANNNPVGALASIASLPGGPASGLIDKVANTLGIGKELAGALVNGGTAAIGGLASGKKPRDALMSGLASGVSNFAGSSLANLFTPDIGEIGAKLTGTAASAGLNSVFANNAPKQQPKVQKRFRIS